MANTNFVVIFWEIFSNLLCFSLFNRAFCVAKNIIFALSLPSEQNAVKLAVAAISEVSFPRCFIE